VPLYLKPAWKGANVTLNQWNWTII